MKLRNIIAVLALMTMTSNGRLAQASVGGSMVQEDAKDQAKLDQIAALLDQLSVQGALKVAPDGRVVVKDSVIKKLKAQGRFTVQMASFGGICE